MCRTALERTYEYDLRKLSRFGFAFLISIFAFPFFSSFYLHIYTRTLTSLNGGYFIPVVMILCVLGMGGTDKIQEGLGVSLFLFSRLLSFVTYTRYDAVFRKSFRTTRANNPAV